jgi:lantibiotic biosynthesis protein
MEINKDTIQAIVDNIADDLEKETNLAPHPSVFAGYGGPVLFFTYLSGYAGNNKHLPLITNIVSKSFRFAEENKMNSSMENGLTGLGWLVQHLVKVGLLDEKDTPLTELDALILRSCEKDIKQKKYDYFTGLIGKGMYFLERHAARDCSQEIIQILDALESLSIQDQFGLTWADYYALERNKKEDVAFNFGMSHGIPSILMFLTKVLAHDIESNRIKNMISGSLNWLMSFRQTNSKEVFFPVRMINYDDLFPDDHAARIAWCYGDLGLTYALYMAGHAVKRHDVCDFSLSMLQAISRKRGMEACGVVDAGLCHGSAGNALVFRNLYVHTGKQEFKTAYECWLQETARLSFHTDGAAGYKAWHGDELGGWINDRGFLEGISGIGLLFLAELNNDPHTGWSDLLLLN